MTARGRIDRLSDQPGAVSANFRPLAADGVYEDETPARPAL